MGNKYIRECIFKTICYADIFEFPLTFLEVWYFFIGTTSVKKESIEKELKTMSLFSSHGFYCLEDRKKIISKRINLEKYVNKKYVIAKKICSILSVIPTILLVGISGGLAMGNVKKGDDIDLFIIAKNNTLWSTRLAVLLLLGVMGVRRSKDTVDVADKICVNMIVTVDGMGVPLKKQNLFTAHEVAQMKPLFVRTDTYQRFLEANSWAGKFLPNALARMKNEESRIKEKTKFMVLEFLSKKLQLWYMKKHVTSEVVSDTILAFHPKDYTKSVLKKYYKDKIK